MCYEKDSGLTEREKSLMVKEAVDDYIKRKKRADESAVNVMPVANVTPCYLKHGRAGGYGIPGSKKRCPQRRKARTMRPN